MIFDVVASPHHAPGEVETVIGDVLDVDALERGMRGCDAVAHLAAAADVDEVTKNPARSEELNARGTLNVLEAARASGVGRVLYASTIWVYGASEGDEAIDEDAALGSPDHLYTATKLAGEMYCRSYAALYDLDCTILRFGIPYGPRARPAAVVPGLRRSRAGRGGADHRRHRRAVPPVRLRRGSRGRASWPRCARRPPTASTTSSGEEDVSIKRIAETVSEIVGDTEVRHVPARAGDFKGVEVSGARAERELQWRARTPFDEGVRSYVEWHREDQQRSASSRPSGSGLRDRRLERAPVRRRRARDSWTATGSPPPACSWPPKDWSGPTWSRCTPPGSRRCTRCWPPRSSPWCSLP
ncbi:MAG: NAD(P)-dependent oxidoreductase [Thermoleophilaceae bacterium]